MKSQVVYAIQHYASRERYAKPKPAWAVVIISQTAAARNAYWAGTLAEAEAWIADRKGVRFRDADRV